MKNMKTLNKIIISAVLFLGLQNHSFATDEQEEMGLTQLAKPGFSQLPIEIQGYIFSFLDQKDFHTASLMCQSWRAAARMSEGERSLDLSGRKLDVKDCEALLQVPFSSLILQRCQLGKQEALILSQSTRIKGLDLMLNSIGVE
jgi:hypothetical protein